MKQKHSKAVKSEIFAELEQEPRFCHILQEVVAAIKKGQEPVVIESWGSYFGKMKFNDKLYNALFTEQDKNVIYPVYDLLEFNAKATLNAEAAKPFLEATVQIEVVKNRHILLNKKVKIEPVWMRELVYFGHRDKNYFKLFFKTLGYRVEEGNVNNRHGLLISLGE